MKVRPAPPVLREESSSSSSNHHGLLYPSGKWDNEIMEQNAPKSKKQESLERRTVIWKSLDTFAVGVVVDDFIRSITKSGLQTDSGPPSQRRYRRRGGCTKYKLEMDDSYLQPAKPCGPELTDYGSHIDKQSKQQDERPRYLRRGAVTKYGLDSTIEAMQPTKIFEAKKNLPRRPLPAPPRNSNMSYSQRRGSVTNDRQLVNNAEAVQPYNRWSMNETDRGSLQEEQDFQSRYLRRCSVTKYSLNSQPTKVMSAHKSCPVLPQTPSNSSFTKNLAEPVLYNLEERKPAATSCAKAKTKKQSLVRFGTVQVNEFPFTLGDNPAVASGAPISSSWDCQHEFKLTIDMYEELRPSCHRSECLVIPVDKRTRILMRAGYTLDEIAHATLEANHIKKQRSETLENQGWERLHVFLESTSRAIRRSVRDARKPSILGAKTA